MTGRTRIRLAAWMVALAIVLGFSSARADIESLYVGGSYSTGIVMDTSTGTATLAGGSIDTSTLNGITLPFLYCVDIPDDVYVGETYSLSEVNDYGYVDNGPVWSDPLNSGTYHQLDSIVVEQVAWLLDNYGVGGQGDPARALQAAIWYVVYNSKASPFTLDPTLNDATMVNDYKTEVTALAGANVASASPVLWISPAPPQNGLSIEQGLVTKVPEPSSILLLGIFAAGVLGLRRKLA